MVSNTHEYDQIVVSKEITLASCSKHTYDLNDFDITEISSSKNDEQMKSYLQPDGDNGEATIVDNKNELSHIEREVTICDTCGDIGYGNLLVICCNCEVGAEHTYCMMEKVDKVPNNWFCYDCTEEVDGMREVRNEKTSSRKRKAKSVINFVEVAEKKSSQRKSIFLNTLSNCKIADFDLNVDLNIELSEVPGIDSNKNLGIDLNEDHDIDLNKNHGIDLNMDPNTNMNMGRHNVDMSLRHASSFEAGYSSNFKTHSAKKPRIDTKHFL